MDLFIDLIIMLQDEKRPSIDDILNHPSVAKNGSGSNAKERKQSSTDLL